MEFNEQVCNSCGEKFSKIGVHWAKSSCSYPNLSETQSNIITGLVMGDGSIVCRGKNPIIQLAMIQPEYLSYIDSLFPEYGMGVKLHQSSERVHDLLWGDQSDSRSNNCSDVYMWKTRTSPVFHQWYSWYSSGQKEIPASVTLSPDIVRTWYVCDGTYKDNSYIRISCNGERGNEDKIRDWFSDIGFTVSNWYEDTNDVYFTFTVDESSNLFSYMDHSVPGFEYKFPKDLSTQR